MKEKNEQINFVIINVIFGFFFDDSLTVEELFLKLSQALGKNNYTYKRMPAAGFSDEILEQKEEQDNVLYKFEYETIQIILTKKSIVFGSGSSYKDIKGYKDTVLNIIDRLQLNKSKFNLHKIYFLENQDVFEYLRNNYPSIYQNSAESLAKTYEEKFITKTNFEFSLKILNNTNVLFKGKKTAQKGSVVDIKATKKGFNKTDINSADQLIDDMFFKEIFKEGANISTNPKKTRVKNAQRTKSKI